MTSLTEQQEKTLIRIMRTRWARVLRKERNIFRNNISELHDWYCYGKASFINKEKISCGTIYETIDLVSLNASINSLNQKLLRTDTPPEIELDFDSEDNSYDGILPDSVAPFAHIFHYRYSFHSLALCKRRIKSNIENTLRDARFKFTHQYNGKDVRHYLAIIAKEEGKTTTL